MYTHEKYMMDSHKEIKTDIDKNSRVCMGFKYNDCYHMLEPDTLIGTSWFHELSGENAYLEEDIAS